MCPVIIFIGPLYSPLDLLLYDALCTVEHLFVYGTSESRQRETSHLWMVLMISTVTRLSTCYWYAGLSSLYTYLPHPSGVETIPSATTLQHRCDPHFRSPVTSCHNARKSRVIMILIPLQHNLTSFISLLVPHTTRVKEKGDPERKIR